MVRSFLHNYFGFNRQQRNGLLVLLCVSLFLLIVRITYPYFIQPDPIEVRNLPYPMSDKAGTVSVDTKSTLFTFDPNTATLHQLKKLGFSEKAATTLIKYRKRHPLKTKENLKQVFGVSPRLYTQLEPFISMGSQTEKASPIIPTETTKQTQARTELNRADSVTLEKLKAIGPAFAKRIIKYREALGGYYQVEQLHEVYGMTDEMYRAIHPQVTVDSTLIRPINVNTDEFKVVNRHPYISYEQTKAIFDARRKSPLNAGSLKTLLADETLFARLRPYLRY